VSLGLVEVLRKLKPEFLRQFCTWDVAVRGGLCWSLFQYICCFNNLDAPGVSEFLIPEIFFEMMKSCAPSNCYLSSSFMRFILRDSELQPLTDDLALVLLNMGVSADMAADEATVAPQLVSSLRTAIRQSQSKHFWNRAARCFDCIPAVDLSLKSKISVNLKDVTKLNLIDTILVTASAAEFPGITELLTRLTQRGGRLSLPKAKWGEYHSEVLALYLKIQPAE
jgi:hypothetical protein